MATRFHAAPRRAFQLARSCSFGACLRAFRPRHATPYGATGCRGRADQLAFFFASRAKYVVARFFPSLTMRFLESASAMGRGSSFAWRFSF
jgi:hypothetical protein